MQKGMRTGPAESRARLAKLYMAGLLERENDPLLPGGLHLGKEVDLMHPIGQGLVGHVPGVRSREHLRGLDPDLVRNIGRSLVIVSGHDLQ